MRNLVPTGRCGNIDALGGQIFGEISGFQVKPPLAHLVNALHGQQAYLPVPVAGVGIALQAEIHQDPGLGDIVFFDPFGGADGHRNDAAGSSGGGSAVMVLFPK